MESDRRLKKVCPQCRAVCVCGHTFPSKRKAQCIAKKEAMKRRRTLETEQEKFARTEQDRLRKQSTRAAETYDQIPAWRRSDRQHKQTTRASETIEQMLHRRECDRLHKETTSASETIEQTLHRLERRKIHMASVRAAETPDKSSRRKETIKECNKSRRKRGLSVENCIALRDPKWP